MSPGDRHVRGDFEFPPEKAEVHRKAVKLEWLTIAYMITAILLLAVTLGQSQAMKAAWIEDILSLFPPAAFLIAARIRTRSPNERFPWGYHRSVSIAYLVAAFALLVLGSYVLLDSLFKLIRAEHPPIGVIELFGEQVWLGWIMLGALAYSGIPPVLLGRAKQKLADELHDKVLYADAEMNRADWMTVAAAMIGVIGIGLGLWWADAVAALFIAQDIVRDGVKNVRAATADLMDARPRRHDGSEPDPVVDEMQSRAEQADWVERARMRLREEGHVYAGEVLVIPRGEEVSVAQTEELVERLLEVSWKAHDLTVVPVEEFDPPSPQVEDENEPEKTV